MDLSRIVPLPSVPLLLVAITLLAIFDVVSWAEAGIAAAVVLSATAVYLLHFLAGAHRQQADRNRHELVRRRLDAIAADTAALKQAARDAEKQRRRAEGELISRTEAVTALYAWLKPEVPLPSTSGWAAAADQVLLIARSAARDRPQLLVECGSGASTVVFGHVLRRNGSGRIVSLEQDEDFAAKTRADVAEHGLSDIVEVRTATLSPWRTTAGAATVEGTDLWYAAAAIADLQGIDLLFIDGPSQQVGPLARYPAMPMLFDRLSPDAHVFCDDFERDDERRMVELWLEEYPDFELVEHHVAKGGCELVRRPA